MDSLTELVVLSVLVVGVPAYLIRMLYYAVVREIASWAPDRRSRHSYQLVTVITLRKNASAAATAANAPSTWWPSETWEPRGRP
ncbi:MAG: hypothetical protein GEU86_15170 [Actinophytocola sp.]|nr:hypothetical protein [Actinophytocola sp.]